MITCLPPKRTAPTLGAFLLALSCLPRGAVATGPDQAVPPVQAAALQLADTNAAQHALADYRGQVVLVNFWASWCTPCVREMPSMQRLSDRLAGRGFNVLAVNVAEPVRRVQAFLARQRLTFTALLDPDSVAFHAWQVSVLPTSFLVDRRGLVRLRQVGELDWDDPDLQATVERLIAEGAE